MRDVALLTLALGLGFTMASKALGSHLFRTEGRPHGFGTEPRFRLAVMSAGLLLLALGGLNAVGAVEGRASGLFALVLGFVFVVKARSSAERHRQRTGIGPVSTNQRVFVVIGILALLVGIAMLLGLP